MASSAENSSSFSGPTIPWSNVIPTLWRSISRRVSIVRFGDGASVFCWLAQRWLAPTNYQFTLSLVFSWLFPPSFSFLFFYFFISVLLIFKFFIHFFFFFLSLSFLWFSFLWCLPFFLLFFYSLSLLLSSFSSEYAHSCDVYNCVWVYCVSHGDNFST